MCLPPTPRHLWQQCTISVHEHNHHQHITYHIVPSRRTSCTPLCPTRHTTYALCMAGTFHKYLAYLCMKQVPVLAHECGLYRLWISLTGLCILYWCINSLGINAFCALRKCYDYWCSTTVDVIVKYSSYVIVVVCEPVQRLLLITLVGTNVKYDGENTHCDHPMSTIY